jgi:hypothetical protein
MMPFDLAVGQARLKRIGGPVGDRSGRGRRDLRLRRCRRRLTRDGSLPGRRRAGSVLRRLGLVEKDLLARAGADDGDVVEADFASATPGMISSPTAKLRWVPSGKAMIAEPRPVARSSVTP